MEIIHNYAMQKKGHSKVSHKGKTHNAMVSAILLHSKKHESAKERVDLLPEDKKKS